MWYLLSTENKTKTRSRYEPAHTRFPNTKRFFQTCYRQLTFDSVLCMFLCLPLSHLTLSLCFACFSLSVSESESASIRESDILWQMSNVNTTTQNEIVPFFLDDYNILLLQNENNEKNTTQESLREQYQSKRSVHRAIVRIFFFFQTLTDILLHSYLIYIASALNA